MSPSLGSTCEGYLGGYRGVFEEAIRRGDSGLGVARHHARVLDGLLGALYCASTATARDAGHRPRGRIAFVAVGGYGRGTVGLHSDVDVLFLCDEPGDPHVEALAKGILYPLWDLGLHIGHVVRGVDETLRLAREDIPTATTLIDLRWVAGDQSIVADLRHAARRQVFEPALGEFLDALVAETEARHERFGGSLYLLEPDVKQGRGGLRDMDVAEWAARARWAAETSTDYVRRGALLAREVEELEAAREMLWRVRNLLHLRAGRQHDRLTFADQEDIATDLGFVDGITLGVEQFMQAYYRHARIVALTAERMLVRARRPPRRRRAKATDLGDGTLVFDGHVTLAQTQGLRDEPSLALRLYQQVVKRDLPPYPFAKDAIARVVAEPSWRNALRADPQSSALFLRLLTDTSEPPLRGGSMVGELHETGLLTAMIPEFEPLIGRVQHDVYHVYTVDVHAVKSVDRLRTLIRGDHHELTLATRLATEAPRRTPLFLATLLHSIGRTFGRDRADHGAALARDIATRLGLSPLDVEHVCWLVQEHGSLYRWATQRDISDPDSIREMAHRVGTMDRLRDLYVLTVAALSTVNPTAMTSWKARMLEDFYFAILDFFELGERALSVAGRAAEIRAEARVGFVGDRGEAELLKFLEQMPDRYFLATPVDVIRRHARAARDRRERPVAITLGPGPSEELAELTVFTDDRPGLLADVAAVLTAHRLAIVSAAIFSREIAEGDTEAVDIFYVRASGRAFEAGDGLTERLERDLVGRLAGDVSAEALIARSPSTPPWALRRSPDVPTEVRVDNEGSASFTIVEVFTRDRAGLLHVVAKELYESGLSIAVSKVNTEGNRVADVFYVADATPAAGGAPGKGGKVREPARLEALRERLLDAVRRFHAHAVDA